MMTLLNWNVPHDRHGSRNAGSWPGFVAIAVLMLHLFLQPETVHSLPLTENILGDESEHRCQPITVESCKDVPYKLTWAKDLDRGILGQKSAHDKIVGYQPLINSQCSPYLRFFLCSRYIPTCSPTYDKILPPCRDVCEHVKASCEGRFQDFSMPWPDELDCSPFPILDQKPTEFCVPLRDVMNYMDSPASPKALAIMSRPTSAVTAITAPTPESEVLPTVQCASPSLQAIPGQTMCAHSCTGHFKFTAQQKESTGMAIAVLAGVGFVLNALIVLTWAMSRRRFAYPERPLVCVAVSFLFFCSTHFITVFGGREITCGETVNGLRPSVTGGGYQDAAPCVVQVVFAYFALHSACIWWVILALSWFLSTNRKWSPDAVQSINGYFHMTALAVPCALGLTVLMWRKIDTDELSGMCGVGNANRAALLVLVLIPLLCYLFTGGALAVCGLISSLTVKELMRSGGQDGRIQKVIWKIGSYSLLFIVAIAVLASSVVAQLATWKEELPIEPNAVADPAMFIRVFLPLSLSILSSWWIFSRKTLSTWQKFGAKLNPCYKTEKIAPVAPVAPFLPRPAQGSVLAEPLLRSYSDNTPFTPWQTPATSYLSSSVMSSSMGKKWIQSPSAFASDNV